MIKVITSITYEALLLPHFTRYYQSLGVDSFIIAIDERVPGIWKKTEEIAATLDASIKLVPASERQQLTGVEGANKEETRKAHVEAGDWIIPADLDEFIQFPAPLSTLIEEMTASDATFLAGKFCDRIAPGGVLAPTLEEPSIWEQYPLACRISEMLILCKNHKVTLCRGDCELSSGHHHVIQPSRPLVARRCVVHHFKWRLGIVEALEKRIGVYKKAGFMAFPESERILGYLDANGGRINPRDFDVVQGWRPDPPKITAGTVVYTAISKGYDMLEEHGCNAAPGMAFVAFTEDLHESHGWQIRTLHGGFDDPCRNTKIHKILPHLYFPDAAYSLWVDGSVVFRSKIVIQELIARYLAQHDIAVFRHPRRHCIYAEAEECIVAGKDDPDVIREQMRKYRYEGYPANAGLGECTVVLRRHTEGMKRFNEVWWEEISRHSKRDQLSFNYTAWKLNVAYNTMPGFVEENEFFGRKLHLNVEPVSEASRLRSQLHAVSLENFELHQALRAASQRHHKMETSKIWLLLKPFRMMEKGIRMCRKRLMKTLATGDASSDSGRQEVTMESDAREQKGI